MGRIGDLVRWIINPIFEPPEDPLKTGVDGSVEHVGNFAEVPRRAINYRLANTPDILSLANAHTIGVVGDGVRVQSRFDDPDLNDAFEAYFKEHARRGNLDITGRFSFNQALRAMEWFKFLNGGVLVRFHYNDAWDIPMRLELIGVDMIDTSINDSKRVRNGLQKDRFGRITHIYIYTDADKNQSRRVSMRNLYYHMQPWLSLSQYTAVSRLASILPRLEKYDEYIGAEVQAAINRAKAGVYWSTNLYSPIMERLDELRRQEGLEYVASEAADIIKEMASRGVGVNGATPIPEGDQIYKLNPNNDTVFDKLSDNTIKSTSAAMGESITTANRDISQGNYASLKMDATLASRIHKTHFDDLTCFIDVYLERLLEIGVRMGDIPIPRRQFYKNKKEYYGRWEVLRRIDDSVDEVKQAQARQINLDTKSTTRSRIYSEQGLDYEEEMKKQIELDIRIELMRRQMYEEAGLEIPADNQQGQTNQTNTQQEETDENGNTKEQS